MARKGNPISDCVFYFLIAFVLFSTLSTSIHLLNELLSLMEGVPLDGVGGSKGTGVVGPLEGLDGNFDGIDGNKGKGVVGPLEGLDGNKDEAGPSHPQIPDLNEYPDDAQTKEELIRRIQCLFEQYEAEKKKLLAEAEKLSKHLKVRKNAYRFYKNLPQYWEDRKRRR
uniref:Transmembrane protein n=1 Tax=Zelkova schneideriana TaxID=172643 RepID=A0A8F1N694_9ROSA|nr:hypothetical protein [Zelkova schneideriana]